MCKCAFDECNCIGLLEIEILGQKPEPADPDIIMPDSIVPWLIKKKHKNKKKSDNRPETKCE